MNLLSLSAAFGAMVWIFQDGHLSSLLNVTPSAIDPTLPVLLFCVVFGLSMDYEVFLLTRMQEAWRRTHDNRAAVAEGLERSGRLVTGAAAIMITVFLAFGLARVVTIKATGIGMAVAVLADATLVRALVVPALMRLLGRANWWAPRWAQRLPAAGGERGRLSLRWSGRLQHRHQLPPCPFDPCAARTRSRYSATRRLPVASSSTLATTWYAGSSGSGRTSTKPPSTNTLRPSTRSTSRPSWSSRRRRITFPLASHGQNSVAVMYVDTRQLRGASRSAAPGTRRASRAA